METTFNNLNVNYAEYSFFQTVPSSEKVDYLFGLYDAQEVRKRGIDLTSFFVSVSEQLSENESTSAEFNDNDSREHVDVMIDDKNILIESNSLRAVKMVLFKFMESGYILQRDRNVEKMFKKDKVTRYLRVFKIINYGSIICSN